MRRGSVYNRGRGKMRGQGRRGRQTLGRRGGGFRWKLMLVFAIGAAGYYFANQKEVPYTGRKQLRTMKPGQEMALGLKSYKQILSDSQVRTSGPIVDKVREIGADIARAAKPEDPGFEWAFNVIDSNQVNAFALPGGYTAVYTGIIPVAANDDGLAAIMGHEVAHALARHGAERMAQQNMQRIVGAGVSLGAGGMDVGAQRAVMGVFGGISKYGFALPFSRSHESEADYIGLILMSRACYDPREAPKLWERMKQASGGGAPPEFQSTHPSPETRIADFRQNMPMAIEIYNQNCPRKIR